MRFPSVFRILPQVPLQVAVCPGWLDAASVWLPKPWLTSFMKADLECRKAKGLVPAPPEGGGNAPSPNESPTLLLNLTRGLEARPRRTARLLRLVTKLTGLRIHVFWHDSMNCPGTPVVCPAARRRTEVQKPQPKQCLSCLRHRWKTALEPGGRGRRFIAPCGLTSFHACLKADENPPVSLVLQSRVANCFPSARQSVSRADFENAVTLARLIVHDLEVSAQAQMATRRWHASNAEISRLRDELGRRRPPGSVEPAIQPGVGSRTRMVVLTMIEVRASLLPTSDEPGGSGCPHEDECLLPFRPVQSDDGSEFSQIPGRTPPVHSQGITPRFPEPHQRSGLCLGLTPARMPFVMLSRLTKECRQTLGGWADNSTISRLESKETSAFPKPYPLLSRAGSDEMAQVLKNALSDKT